MSRHNKKSKIKNQKLKTKNLNRKSQAEKVMPEGFVEAEQKVFSSPEPEKTGNRARLFFVTAVVVLLLAIFYFAYSKWGKVLVAADVNGRQVSKLELWQKLEKRAGQQTLDEMVNEILIEQEAQRKNVQVSDKEIEAKIKDLETRFKGKDGLNQTLAFQGMTREDLKRQLKYQVMVEKMIPKTEVKEKEIETYYDQNGEQFGEQTYDEVKEQIKNQLLQQKTSKAFSDWFDKLKKGAKISKYL